MIQLRAATRADARTILRKVLGAGLDPTSLDWRRFVLAIDDANGHIVGCAQIKRHTDCDEFGSLVVNAAQRGQGIGARLVSHLSERAEGALYLVCLQKMQPYYERFCFRLLDQVDTPRTLRIKTRAGRLFGLSVIAMRLDRASLNP
jgi:amino-acid N-acetyltransferase